jgi:hypothetical protein
MSQSTREDTIAVGHRTIRCGAGRSDGALHFAIAPDDLHQMIQRETGSWVIIAGGIPGTWRRLQSQIGYAIAR